MCMARGRLLILDDDETVGRLLAFVAESVDFEARLCERPQAFFDAVADWSPTHVAIDLSMPEIGGLEVVRRLAAAGCRAEVIISSGAGQAEIEAAALEARTLGMRTCGVLPKPFSVASVRALLAGVPDGVRQDA
jgi:FixJ family two-component response regulator